MYHCLINFLNNEIKCISRYVLIINPAPKKCHYILPRKIVGSKKRSLSDIYLSKIYYDKNHILMFLLYV